MARHGTPRTPQELRGHNCMSYVHISGYNDWTFSGVNGRETVTVSGTFRVNNGLALRTAALSGIGIIMQPQGLVQ